MRVSICLAVAADLQLLKDKTKDGKFEQTRLFNSWVMAYAG